MKESPPRLISCPVLHAAYASVLGTRPQEEKGGTARSLIIVLSFAPTITQYAARATSQRPAALTHREHPRFQGLFPTRKGPGNEDPYGTDQANEVNKMFIIWL